MEDIADVGAHVRLHPWLLAVDPYPYANACRKGNRAKNAQTVRTTARPDWKQDDNQHGSCDRRTLRNPAFGCDTKFDLRVEVRLSLLWALLLASPRETDSVGWRELLPFMPFAEACSQNVDKIEIHQP